MSITDAVREAVTFCVKQKLVAKYASGILYEANTVPVSRGLVWWSTYTEPFAITWHSCASDGQGGFTATDTTYNLYRNSAWTPEKAYVSSLYGNPVYFNGIRYRMYAGELRRSSAINQETGNVEIVYDAVWEMSPCRLLPDGTYDMYNDPDSTSETGGWTNPIPRNVTDDYRKIKSCVTGECEQIESGWLCSTWAAPAEADPVECVPAFESVTRYYSLVSVSDDPDDPEDPDNPDNPDDPEEPTPGATDIEYVSLGNSSTILTNIKASSATTIECEYEIYAEDGTNETYLQRNDYKILGCPIQYYNSSDSCGSIYRYSTPDTVTVSYKDGDVRALLPQHCGNKISVSAEGEPINTKQSCTLKLSSSVSDSTLSTGTPGSVQLYNSGSFSAGLLPIYVGGYVCGGGSMPLHCVGERRIYKLTVTGTSGSAVTFTPVVSDDGRNGLRNTSDNSVVYPMSLRAGSHVAYKLDYISLRAGRQEMQLSLCITASSSLSISFYTESKEYGIIPLFSFEGSCAGKRVRVVASLTTAELTPGSVSRFVDVGIYNEYKGTAFHYNQPVEALASAPCKLEFNMRTGIYVNAARIFDLAHEGLADWDAPTTTSSGIILAPNKIDTTGSAGSIAGTLRITEVGLSNMYRYGEDYTTGVITLLPEMSTEMVARLGTLGSWCYPTNMSSYFGYGSAEAGVFAEPVISI